jgi:hypothetical protein
MAAGVTPSPEMVAAAGESGIMRRPAALVLFAATVGGLLLAYAASFVARASLIQRVPLDRSPEVLADRAREMIKGLRGSGAPVDRAYGLAYNQDIVRHIAQRDPSPDRWDRLGAGQPAAVYFWYRESPAPLGPASRWGTVTDTDPSPAGRGMVTIHLDLRGRLIGLRAISARVDEETAEPPPTDWTALFGAAGLDPARFEPARPVWVPLGYADARDAWDGVLADRPDVPIHVEAAAYRGRPVYFEIVGTWLQTPARAGPGFAGLTLLSVAVLAAGLLLARLNLRRGRGDRRGAWRLAVFVFVCRAAQWVLSAGHVADPLAEWAMATRAAGRILFECVSFWVYYVAVEPYVRRLWPEALVSWSRLLAGRWRDPLIGRDALIGILGASAVILGCMGAAVLFPVVGAGTFVSTAADLTSLAGGRALADAILEAVVFALQMSFLVIVPLLLFRVMIRSRSGLLAAFVALQIAVYAGLLGEWFGGGLTPAGWLALSPLVAASTLIPFEVVTRYGLLPLAALFLPIGLGIFCPIITPSLSTWHAASFVIPFVLLLALAVYGFRTALAGQPLFRGGILAD